MNSVNISGILKETIDDKYRYFEYLLPYNEENEDGLVTKIVVTFWTKQPKPRLIVLPENTRVMISGHLDVSQKFGTILLVEQLEVIR